MKNYNQEILNYVNSKQGTWSDSTISTAYSKLSTIVSLHLEPARVYDRLQSKGYSRYTIQNYFTLIKDYEKQTKKTAHFETWIKRNRLKFKNCYREKTTKITREQYQALLIKAPSDDLYNLLILVGTFGLRKSEAFNARWEDFAENRFHVINGKGNKNRVLPIKITLLKNPLSKGLVLPTKLHYDMFIDSFTLHDFRAYAITEWVNRGLNLKEAAVLAGHSSTATTDKYIRTDLREIEEKLNGNA